VKARLAKKVLRVERALGLARHRYSTYVAAHRRWVRFYNKDRLGYTPGGRLGRWDPTMPTDPEEIPF
jgi:hypothetical protein